MDKARPKPFRIPKRAVWDAYKQVKANSGTAGVDDQSMKEFEKKLESNLYKLWNRMSSGSYFPKAVLRVEIPKKDGGSRPLGIPAICDRIAQMVAKNYLEPLLEPHFHEDSYGYRPGRSQLQAVGVTRKRCWQLDWVLDLDVKGCFDNLDHDLIMRAVRHHTDCKWVLLYIERWLKAPVQMPDGTLADPDKGTPQGGVISPLLMNLYLHYAFDAWMERTCPHIPFERYADDVVAHCKTERQAQWLKRAVGERLATCKLELHPQKTKIVYCQDSNRKEEHPNRKFDFLGYRFRPRRAKNRSGQFFVAFSPAMSDQAAKKVREEMRSWRIPKRTNATLEDFSSYCNPKLRGWFNYYSKYRKSGAHPTFKRFNHILVRWAARKFKRLKGSHKRARQWLRRIARKEPHLFVHWRDRALQP